MRRSTIEYIENSTGKFFLSTERSEEHIVLEPIGGGEERDLSMPEFKANYIPMLKHGD